jgi:hypothetical protein
LVHCVKEIWQPSPTSQFFSKTENVPSFLSSGHGLGHSFSRVGLAQFVGLFRLQPSEKSAHSMIKQK